MSEINDKDVQHAYAELNRQEPLCPPKALDDAILAEAHRAVSARPKMVKSRLQRWTPPFAMAATVVLATTLFVLLPESTPLDPDMEAVLQESIPAAPQAKRERQQSASAVAQSNHQAPEIVALAPAAEPVVAAPAISQSVAVESLAAPDDESALAGFALEEAESVAAEADFADAVATPFEKKSIQIADPAPAVKRITELLDQQQWEQADKAFADFKKTFPGHQFIDEYPKKRDALRASQSP